MSANPGASEHEKLDAIAGRYDPSDPSQQFDFWLKRLQAATVEPWLRGERLLELGCATGELTSLLAPMATKYHVVEGSERNIAAARARVPDAEFTHSLWEDFEPRTVYSDVVLFNAIEHVEEPVQLLARVRSWLMPNGRVHIVVPNGLSLHRLVGVELGLQPDPLALTPGDEAQGHRRNYTVDSLQADVRAAGWQIVHLEGIFLKVLPNAQMLGWEWPLIEAMHAVGRRLPDQAAELYVVAEPA